MYSARNLFARSRRRNLAIGSLAIALAGVAIVGTPGAGGSRDDAASDEDGCHADVVPAAALPHQPGPVLCTELGAGPGTAVDSRNGWRDEFDHGLSFASFEDAGYVTSVVGDPGRTAFWRHADHWMVDIAPEGAATAGAFVRPDRSFRFEGDIFVAEMVATAGHADYGVHAWPEIVVTTGARPTARRPDGLYAYDHFSGHTTLGCRLESKRTPVCSLFDNTANGVDGGRIWEISFFQRVGDATFGGGPWVDDDAWRTCDADTDPDSSCRDRFRLELTPDSLTLIVNGVRYFAQSGLPEMPADFLTGDLYVYAASMLWRNPDDVVRFHWDDLIVDDGGAGTTVPPPMTAPPMTAPPTTLAPAPTTTLAPAPSTTTTATPATTILPTTTATPTATVLPTTTAVLPTPTAAPMVGSAFIEDFTGNTGLDRFDTGVYHRDDHLVANTTWTGDHDLDCGSPDTQRTIHRDRPDESFYLCRDHLMTSVGDTSGYSIGWFSPRQTFERGAHTAVSWEVNVTDLGGRQWWEVILVPEGEPFLATIDWLADTANIDRYGPSTIAVGIGPFGGDDNIFSGGVSRRPLDWRNVGDADPEARASKAIRRPFRMIDNLDGTITFEYLGETVTYPGRFPERFRVYFKDHNYTPDKDGIPAGHTWHWDTIAIR